MVLSRAGIFAWERGTGGHREARERTGGPERQSAAKSTARNLRGIANPVRLPSPARRSRSRSCAARLPPLRLRLPHCSPSARKAAQDQESTKQDRARPYASHPPTAPVHHLVPARRTQVAAQHLDSISYPPGDRIRLPRGTSVRRLLPAPSASSDQLPLSQLRL